MSTQVSSRDGRDATKHTRSAMAAFYVRGTSFDVLFIRPLSIGPSGPVPRALKQGLRRSQHSSYGDVLFFHTSASQSNGTKRCMFTPVSSSAAQERQLRSGHGPCRWHDGDRSGPWRIAVVDAPLQRRGLVAGHRGLSGVRFANRAAPCELSTRGDRRPQDDVAGRTIRGCTWTAFRRRHRAAGASCACSRT